MLWLDVVGYCSQQGIWYFAVFFTFMLQKRPKRFLFQISLQKYLKWQKERFRAIIDQIISNSGLNDPLKAVHFSPHQVLNIMFRLWIIFRIIYEFILFVINPMLCLSLFLTLLGFGNWWGEKWSVFRGSFKQELEFIWSNIALNRSFCDFLRNPKYVFKKQTDHDSPRY